MKYIKFALTQFLVLFFSIMCFSQNTKFKVDNNYGFLFFDLIQTLPADEFYGYHLAGEIAVTADTKISDRFSIESSIGYQHIYFLIWWFQDLPSKDYYSNGLLRINAKYTTANELCAVRVGLSNYYLLNKDLHHQLSKRYYLTMDIGSSFKISNRINLNISTPFALLPPFRGILSIVGQDGIFIDVKPFVEINGLMLGLSYKL